MADYQRAISAVGGSRLVAVLGGLYVALAVGRVVTVVGTGGSIAAAAADFILVGIPGASLVYGEYWLRRSELPSDARPRLVAWCLAGFATMLFVVELVNLEPGVDIAHPFWTAVLATAIGTAAGFAVGANDALAVTRAREVEEVNEQLQDANEKLERQNDRLERFADTVAHELRNPLSVAQIYLQRAAGGDETAREEVEEAHGRIEEMIEVLLVTARKNDPDIAVETVSLADVAETTWTAIPAEDADLVVETERSVCANPVHLRHLFENLFENSVEHGSTSSRPPADDAVERSSSACETESHDAVGDGVGTLTVRVGDLPSGFYVADDGPGIPPEEREAVFDAGYTTNGTGFGLTLVARLAETYGWEYAVREGDQGGARFEFTGVEFAAVERQRN